MSGSPTETISLATSHTHVLAHDDTNDLHAPQLPNREGPSANPDHKSEDKIKDKDVDDDDDDWEHDSVNPRNWCPTKKWIATTLVSMYTFVAPLGSSMMAPALPDVAIKYGITSPTITAMTMSIFLLSFAIGPLFMAPLSEMYGRAWVLHLANLFFLAFNIGCALSPNTATFIVFRLLAGLAGSAPMACGGGVIADLFAERDRASAMALYTLGPLMGPCLGPIMAGFIAESVGVQNLFYLIAALCGIAAVLGIPLLKETYAPVIKLRRGKAAQDPEKAATCPALTPHQIDRWAYLWINLKRPVILVTRSFICFILSFYMALMYGIYYLMFATFPVLFSEVYHFSTGISGLAYIGIGFGFLSATIFGAKISDKIYIYLATKNGGKGKPEMRVPALIFGSFFVPVGIFWYGWSAQAHIHYIMPIIGTGIFGFGLMTTFLPIQLYLVDTFTYAASAMAAASVLRSLLGFAFPLFGEQMFATLGYGGGNSLLAGLAIVIGIPFPIWIYYAGEGIRAKSSLARH
ncbi:hypothetical protein AZE42_04087 [Rhizopogon vesiculosus]|uniref:Major facilitator superfamily (MFS) profile domain-containing protein n=1 Tax=Rhizopogon vesiculosus TaxID=180088 RepID=A0A1J8QS62_9AGAM|nr:hypothetical protein AZE42_04087 [Rhizopogon vesiculosus]